MHHAHGAGQDGVLTNMPYIGRMREEASEATPFMAMSHNTICGHTRTEKRRSKVVLTQMGESSQGVPASTPCMGGKRVQLQCPTQSYTINHMTSDSEAAIITCALRPLEGGPSMSIRRAIAFPQCLTALKLAAFFFYEYPQGPKAVIETGT